METSKINLDKKRSKQKLEKPNAKGCVVIIIVAIGIFFLFKAGCSSEQPVYTAKQLDSIYNEKENSMAIIMGQDFVKQRLKAPASADFPFGETYAVHLRDSTFAVKGVVDSQNSFGAMLRTKFYVKIKQTGPEDWKLIDIELYE